LLLEDVSVAYPVFGGKAAQGAHADSDTVGGRIEQMNRSSRVVALQEISLDLGPGDKLGVVGHNGSGKSTLLRAMAGIYAPLGGRITIDGEIGAMFSTGIGVQPHATGRENITLSGLLRGLSRKESEARFDAIADFSELGEYLEYPVNTYSRGMAMRLSFAIATEFDPDVLLLDEWLGAGDRAFRKKAEKRMQDLVGRAGILVLASHRLPLLRNNCERCLWLEHGRIKMDGPAKEVVDAFEEEIDVAQPKLMQHG
jgi:ABC-type polysaccharide/polyol phosphate transport system ATPase subunit